MSPFLFFCFFFFGGGGGGGGCWGGGVGGGGVGVSDGCEIGHDGVGVPTVEGEYDGGDGIEVLTGRRPARGKRALERGPFVFWGMKPE
jgi:hypothetical protein